MSVCVHGLGHIGLATAALFANNGHEVTGFDVDDDLVSNLQQGDVTVDEPALEAYVERALSDGLRVDTEPLPAEYHLVCVPTPYDTDRDRAILSNVTKAGRNVAEELRPGDAVVLESTVPPGTTRDVFGQTLSQDGLVPGRDFHLGYVPETVMPGNIVTEIRSNPRIVGGVDQDSTDAVVELYEPVTSGPIHMAPDAATAEFAKLAQNAARDVVIAYANMLALVANDYGVDVRTAIELANNHPRVDILDPGPGVGGHCLPVDPLFLGHGSDETDLIGCAREVNDGMPSYVADKVIDALETVYDATVAVLGVTYKGNVSDTRNSPGLAITRQLEGRRTPPRSATDGGHPSVDVRIHDPHADDPTLDLLQFEEAIAGADAIVIAAGHDEFARVDPERVGEAMNRRLVVDPIDLLEREQWTRHGFEVQTL